MVNASVYGHLDVINQMPFPAFSFSIAFLSPLMNTAHYTLSHSTSVFVASPDPTSPPPFGSDSPVILRTPFARNHASAWESISLSLSLGKLCKNRSNAFQSSSNPSRLLYGLACLIESIVRATNRGGQFRARWAIYLVSFWLLKIECISK